MQSMSEFGDLLKRFVAAYAADLAAADALRQADAARKATQKEVSSAAWAMGGKVPDGVYVVGGLTLRATASGGAVEVVGTAPVTIH